MSGALAWGRAAERGAAQAAVVTAATSNGTAGEERTCAGARVTGRQWSHRIGAAHRLAAASDEAVKIAWPRRLRQPGAAPRSSRCCRPLRRRGPPVARAPPTRQSALGRAPSGPPLLSTAYHTQRTRLPPTEFAARSGAGLRDGFVTTPPSAACTQRHCQQPSGAPLKGSGGPHLCIPAIQHTLSAYQLPPDNARCCGVARCLVQYHWEVVRHSE